MPLKIVRQPHPFCEMEMHEDCPARWTEGELTKKVSRICTCGCHPGVDPAKAAKVLGMLNALPE